jgi:hypothetical protein
MKLQLTANRYTLAAFTALAVVTLIVTVGVIAWVVLTPPPARAGTCGSIYLTSFTCHNEYTCDRVKYGTCPDGSPRCSVKHWNMSKWANPYSNRIDGYGGETRECNPTLNCPSKCN